MANFSFSENGARKGAVFQDVARRNSPNTGFYPTTNQYVGPQYPIIMKTEMARTELEETIWSKYASVDPIVIPRGSDKFLKGLVKIGLMDDRNINDQGIGPTGLKIPNGNLYGSSRNFETIASVFPILSEDGGRVNRVGFTQIEVFGDFIDLGLFFDYTRNEYENENDEHNISHNWRIAELITAAHKITEDALQADIISSAGTIGFPKNVTRASQLGKDTYVSYATLVNFQRALDIVKAPKKTELIGGSGNIDTLTTIRDRTLICHPDVVEYLKTLIGPNRGPAFIPAEKYTKATGGVELYEVGTIARFRIIAPPDMLYWEGVGAPVTADDGVMETNGRANVYPLLYIAPGSFNTVRFNHVSSDGKLMNFRMAEIKPGTPTKEDPYGMYGQVSIQWKYGFIAMHPEKIGLLRTSLPTIDSMMESIYRDLGVGPNGTILAPGAAPQAFPNVPE